LLVKNKISFYFVVRQNFLPFIPIYMPQ
jgi:hypothetical protein